MSQKEPTKSKFKKTLSPHSKARPRAPPLKGAKDALSNSSLAKPKPPVVSAAGKKKKFRKPSKLAAAVAAAAVAAVTTFGAVDTSHAAKISSLQGDPMAQMRAIEERSKPHEITPASSSLPFEEGVTISSLLRDKQEQKKDYDDRVLRGIKVPSETKYIIPTRGGVEIEVSIDNKKQELAFRRLLPLPNEEGIDPSFALMDSGKLSYAKLGLKNPVLYGHNVGLWAEAILIDEATGKYVSIHINKSDFNLGEARVQVFDKNVLTYAQKAEHAFTVLSTLPRPMAQGTEASRIFQEAFKKAEESLAKSIANYDAGDHKEDLGLLIDDFIEQMYTEVFKTIQTELKKATKNMSPQHRKEVLSAIEPYFMAILIRPHAIWEGHASGSGQEIQIKLDELILSSGFSAQKLKKFVIKYGLKTPYGTNLETSRKNFASE